MASVTMRPEILHILCPLDVWSSHVSVLLTVASRVFLLPPHSHCCSPRASFSVRTMEQPLKHPLHCSLWSAGLEFYKDSSGVCLHRDGFVREGIRKCANKFTVWFKLKDDKCGILGWTLTAPRFSLKRWSEWEAVLAGQRVPMDS